MKTYRVKVTVVYAANVEAETEQEAYDMGFDIAGDGTYYEEIYSIEAVEE